LLFKSLLNVRMMNEKHNKLLNSAASIFTATAKKAASLKMPPGISNRHKPAELFVDLIKICFMALKQLHLFFNKSYARKKLKKMLNSTIF